MTEDLRIRRATADDLELLVHFNRAMAEETEQKELARDVVTAGVAAALADPAKGFYVIAMLGDEPAGGLLVTTEWSDWRNADFWWIQSVYVERRFRQRGVYRALHGYVEEEARRRGDVCGIRLYVDADNGIAQGVYARLGMKTSRYLLLESDTIERR